MCLKAEILLRDTVQLAGIRHLIVLGRSGRFGTESDLADAMRDGWAASVAVTKCDVAVSEDSAAVFSRRQSRGEPAVYDQLRRLLAPFRFMWIQGWNVCLTYGCSKWKLQAAGGRDA